MEPDAGGYAWAEAEYDFVPLAGGLGVDLGMATASAGAPLSLPWPITFYGAPFTDVVAQENGAMSFGTCGVGVDASNSCLPAAEPNCNSPDLAVLWDNVVLSPSSGAVWSWHDTVGDRFIVSWEDVPLAIGGEGSFQVHLFADGRAEYHYSDLDFGNGSYDWGAGATVGIQDRVGGTADSGGVVPYSCNEAVLSDGLALAFYPVGSTLDVCASSCSFSDPASALAAAVAGDVVELDPGTYAGCFEVPGGVTLAGTGVVPGDVVIDGICSSSSTDPAIALKGQLFNLRVDDAHTAVALTGMAGRLERVDLRASDTGVLVPADSSLWAERVDIRGAEVAVEVEADASADIDGLVVVGTGMSATGVLSSGELELHNATIATDSGSALLGYGIRVLAGEATLGDIVVVGWGTGATSSVWEHEIGPAGYWSNITDITGQLAEADGTPSLYGVDPLFASWPCSSDVEGCDLHPQSTDGRWDPALQAFVGIDPSTSPLVDGGSMVSGAYAGETDTECLRVNLGAYGGTAEASLGPLAPVPPFASADPSACKAWDATSGQWYGSLHTAALAASDGHVIQLAQATIDATAPGQLPPYATVEPLPLATLPLLQGPSGTSSWGWAIGVQSGATLTDLQIEGSDFWAAIGAQNGSVVGGTFTGLVVGSVSPAYNAVYLESNSGTISGAWTFEDCELNATHRAIHAYVGAGEIEVIDSSLEGDSYGLFAQGFSVVDVTDSTLVSSLAYTGAQLAHALRVGYTSFQTVTVTGSTLFGRVRSDSPTDLTVIGSVLADCAPASSRTWSGLELASTSGTLAVHGSLLRFEDSDTGLAGIAPNSAQVLFSNVTILGTTVDLSGAGSAVFTNSYAYSPAGPTLLLPPGTPPAAVTWNGYYDNTGSPTFADLPVDTSNFECDAGIPLTCDYADLSQYLVGPGTCLEDAGDPTVFDADGSTVDVGATGGPFAAFLLGQFDLDSDGFPGSLDCDDEDDTVYPGAPDACGDGFDDDCSGGDAPDADVDGYEDVACGGDDCDDADPELNPAELDLSCDGIDQDCTGADEEDWDGDGYLCSVDDCDDLDAAINPGAVEACNGVDDDCDGSLPADEQDLDLDSYLACGDDCDDLEPDVYADAPELCDGLDDDCDGVVPADEVDGDGDGSLACADCDDADPDNFPGNPEACDGADNDCDGSPETGGEDDDGDGYALCAATPDCDDTDSDVYPGAPELCDGLDNDCDAAIPADEVDDDADGWLACDDCDDDDGTSHPEAAELCDGVDNDCDEVVPSGEADDDGDGARLCEEDCDDDADDIYPGAPELCDGVDNDCDESLPEAEADADLDGYRVCDLDCADLDPTAYPGALELCDSVDNDCDGEVPTDELDADVDGYRPCDDPGDCDDSRSTVVPDFPLGEVCDGNDNDCDGVLPEEEEDPDGDGWIACEGFQEAEAADGIVGTGDCDQSNPDLNPDGAEACDGLDNDCDGFLIEGEVDSDGDGDLDCEDPPVFEDEVIPAPGCAAGCSASGRRAAAGPGLLLLVLLFLRRSRPGGLGPSGRGSGRG